MGYMHKVIIYGKYIQTTEYAKEISSERVCPPAFFKERVRNPFAKRRRNNVRKSKRLFVQRVLCGLGSLGTPLFVTLTYAENMGSLEQAHEDFNAFAKRTRRHFGQHLRYIAVAEFQKRGAVHFHCFFWGLPDNTVETERFTRICATLWGKGFVDIKHTDGNEKLTTYLGKYMIKMFKDQRLGGKRHTLHHRMF